MALMVGVELGDRVDERARRSGSRRAARNDRARVGESIVGRAAVDVEEQRAFLQFQRSSRLVTKSTSSMSF